MPLLALALAIASISPVQEPTPGRPSPPWRLEVGEGGPAHGFGHAVVSLGDHDRDGWDDVAVSAPCGGLGEPGAVWVLDAERGRVRWMRQGEAPGDEFGHALAALHWNGDRALDLAIGARLADVDGRRSGRVTVHSGIDGAVLARFEGSEATGHFGAALAALDDVDGDAIGELAIGAPGEADGAGRVHVHAGRTGALLLRLAGTGVEHQVGAHVGPFVDVNSDGHADLLIGAPGNPLRAPDAGALEIRDGRSGRTARTYWGQGRGDRLGERVTRIGDVDADGVPDVAVSAPSAGEQGRSDVGRVDVLSGRRGELLGTVRGADAGDFLGRALLAGTGWTGKGQPALAIGVPYATNPASPSAVRPGAVLIFDAATRELWHRVGGTRSHDHFGSAIAAVDTPKGVELWIGAPGRGDTLLPEREKIRGFVRAVPLPAPPEPAR